MHQAPGISWEEGICCLVLEPPYLDVILISSSTDCVNLSKFLNLSMPHSLNLLSTEKMATSSQRSWVDLMKTLKKSIQHRIIVH